MCKWVKSRFIQLPGIQRVVAPVPGELIDDARDFVSWNAGILNSGPSAFFREHVAVANTTGLHLDTHVSDTWLRNLALDDLEIGSRLRNLRYLHCCYCDSCCHKSSFEFSAISI